MGERLLFGFGRALWWNLVVGFLTSLAVAVVIASVIAHEGEAGGSAVLVVGPMLGVAYGFLAGIVHGIVQLPLLAMNATRVVRAAAATAVSIALAVGLVALGSDEPIVAPPLLMFVPYVLLSPWFAGRYDEASTDAAVSAARRNGDSTASRNDGSTSASSRATSE